MTRIILTELLPRPTRHALYCWRALKYFRAAGIGMIHVPKSAGTSMAGLLFGRSLGHFTLSEYTRNLGPVRLLSPPLFAVIREPEDRFLSAYRFFRQGRTRDAGVQDLHPRANLWKQDVDLFIDEYLTATPDCGRDYIFQTQARFVLPTRSGRPSLALFRLEDINALQCWLSEQLQSDIVFPHKNRSSTDHSVKLTAAQRARVREIFQADFNLYDQI